MTRTRRHEGAASRTVFNIDVTMNNSVDCRRFFDRSGEDIVFGQPACGGNVIRQPTSCFETETLEGRLSADNVRF